MSPFDRSEQYLKLCRKAASNWPTGGDYFILSEEEEAFSRVHSPRLVAALWKAYEALVRLSSGANMQPRDHGAGCRCAYHEAHIAIRDVERFEPPSSEQP